MDGDDDSAMLPPAGAESVEGVALAAAAIIAMVALVLGVRYALRWWSSSPAAEDMVVLKGTADDADADADEDADADATVPVIVQWCGGCGFQDRVRCVALLICYSTYPRAHRRHARKHC